MTDLNIAGSWVARRSVSFSERVSEQRERQRRREAGQRVYARPVALVDPSRQHVAKRSSFCPVCGERIDSGLLVVLEGPGRDVHVACMEAEWQKSKGPSAVVKLAKARSKSTEARRRVFWAVVCPECSAGVEEPCRDFSGARRTRNHVQRMLAYSAAKRKRLVKASAQVLEDLRQVLIEARRRTFKAPADPSLSVAGLYDVVDDGCFDAWDAEVEWASLRF